MTGGPDARERFFFSRVGTVVGTAGWRCVMWWTMPEARERRLRAAQLAGLDRLPALVREVEDPLELALIENLQREDLSPLEEAEGLATLIARHGYSHREVAELLGKSRPYVSNILALT